MTTQQTKIPATNSPTAKKLLALGTSAHEATMNSYTPYLIAGVFVALTALLTILLTFMMDSKSELDQVLAQQAREPILVRARSAFGQETPLPGINSEIADLPSIPPIPVAITKTTNSAEPVIEYNNVATVQDDKIEILRQPLTAQQISVALSYHMEMQFRFLEDRYRRVFSSASYERMVNRRRESFHRMMRKRGQMMRQLGMTAKQPQDTKDIIRMT